MDDEQPTPQNYEVKHTLSHADGGEYSVFVGHHFSLKRLMLLQLALEAITHHIKAIAITFSDWLASQLLVHNYESTLAKL